MTKAELIAHMAAEVGLTKAKSQEVLDIFIGAIFTALKKEGRFALQGLGAFNVVKRKKREGRNPRTGEAITIKAGKAVKFKASKSLKDKINR